MFDSSDLFDTPMLQYLELKKTFFRKYLNSSVWGEFGSKKQVEAFAGLLGYLQQTNDLADQYPQLTSDISNDNRKLLIEHMIPFPNKLYEQILLAAVEDEHNHFWQQPDSVTMTRMGNFLERKKNSCLAAYENMMWKEVHENLSNTFEENANDSREACDFAAVIEKVEERVVTRSQLWKLRNRIYARIKFSQKVDKLLSKYYSLTQDFIEGSKPELSVDEIAIFENRVKITEKAAKVSNTKVRLQKNLRIFTPDLEKLIVSEFKHSEKDSDDEYMISEHIMKDSPITLITDDNHSEGITRNSNAIPAIVTNQGVLNSEIRILPDVPGYVTGESDKDFIDTSGEEIDKEIRIRLTRLQLFSKAWNQENFSSKDSMEESLVEHIALDNIEETKATTEKVYEEGEIDAFSLEKDRQNFNQWYYAQIDKCHLAKDNTKRLLDDQTVPVYSTEIKDGIMTSSRVSIDFTFDSSSDTKSGIRDNTNEVRDSISNSSITTSNT